MKITFSRLILLLFAVFSMSIFAKGDLDRLNFNIGNIKNYIIANNNTKLSPERAKQLALSHSKVSERDAKFTKLKLDRENGIFVYEIEFYTESNKYEYDINANTGEIVEFEVERR